jgi:hypothetical protein
MHQLWAYLMFMLVLSDPRVVSRNGGSQSFGSDRVFGAGSNNSGEGERATNDRGLASDFWAFSLDREQLEHDIERLQQADLDTLSQLPPEHLLVLI